MKKTLLGLVASLLVSHIFASLPDGYTQLEWIESNGRQWIDTGVKARNGLVVSARLKMLSAVAYQAYFGASDGDGVNSLALTLRLDSGEDYLRIHYGSSSKDVARSRIYRSTPATYTIANGNLSVDGVSLGSVAESDVEFSSDKNIYLGWMGGDAENGGSSVYKFPGAAVFYSFTIQNADGTYVRDMVPARMDENGSVGMFDKVNEIFYASDGSDSFRAGPRVDKVYVYDTSASAAKRSEMIVSGYTGGDEVQKGFPVLVRVSESTIEGFSYSQCLMDGADVFFALDEEGKNRLACDIEKWDPTGISPVWVKLPELSGTETKFYMFWGSGAVALRPDKKETWSEYVGVWHMNAYDAGIGVVDETGHGYNATNIAKSENVSTVTASPFAGNALRLSEGLQTADYDEFLETYDEQTDAMPDSLTISCFFTKPEGIDARSKNVFGKYGGGAESTRWGYLNQIAGETTLSSISRNGITGWTSLSCSCPSVKKNWIYHAFVASADSTISYINGQESNKQKSYTVSERVGKIGITVPFRIGSAGGSPISVDELRVTRVPRSSAWVAAEYASMNDADFVTAGVAQIIIPEAEIVSEDNITNSYGKVEEAFAAAKDGDLIVLKVPVDIGAAYNSFENMSLVIDGGDCSISTSEAITVGAGRTLTVKGGVFSGLSLIANGGTVAIEGGTFTDGAFEAVALPDAESKVTSVIGISGGSFVSSSFKSYMNANGKAGASSTRIDINGGEFDGCKAASGYMGNAKITDEGNRFSHKIAKHVSVAGGVQSEYDTLEEAIAAAADGVEAVITLQCGVIVPKGKRIDIAEGKEIVFAGGDYDVLFPSGTVNGFAIDGKLVIKDGVYHNMYSWIGYGSTGTAANEKICPNAFLQIDDGVFYNTELRSYGYRRKPTLQDEARYRMKIYGGEFFGTTSLHSYYRDNAYIYGGKFYTKPTVGVSTWSYHRSTIHLHGGVFLESITYQTATENKDAAATLPSGYTLSAITDTSSGSSQTYYVPKSTHVALNWNSGRTYTTLADAVADAKSGEEIRYFADIADTSEVVVPRGKTVTIVATGAYTLANSFTVGGKLILKNAGFTGEFVLSGAGEIVTHFDPNAEESKVNLKGSKFRDNRDGTWSATQGFAIIIL